LSTKLYSHRRNKRYLSLVLNRQTHANECDTLNPCNRCHTLGIACVSTTGQIAKAVQPVAPVAPKNTIKINVYLDLNGIIAKSGPETFFIFGVDARILVGRHILGFMPRLADREWLVSVLERKTDETMQREIVVVHKNSKGVKLYAECSLVSIIECVNGIGLLNRYIFMSFGSEE
jgi:hypothetical protein